MAEFFSHVFGGPSMKAFCYHFAILFEALFILTAVDAGTRAGRFMLQDLIALAVPGFKDTKTIAPGIVATALTVAAWGFFLYQGRSEEHTSELQSLMRISYAVFCLKKKHNNTHSVNTSMSIEKLTNNQCLST